jgi:hypothetical protein
MKKIMNAGLVLGLSVAVWSFIYGFAGLYRNPSLAWTFTVGAILIQIGVLVWGLKQTVQDGRRYMGQLGAGLLICFIGGIIIIFSSLIFTTVAFPDNFDVTAEMQAEAWANAGWSDEQIDATLERTAFMRTPVGAAVAGFIGTMATGLIISLIVAAFIRVKD